ncbi:hypothetical protein [Variovorax sp. KK3]|uniref:hypothetical protein n=1 Tax=Variovorax sp. KK3 TaxID=1855728 RepID=UPI00097C6B6F|nr:hypothetical protein [Variovorax sp. KK3]
MTIPVIKPSRDDILRCVVHFDDMPRIDGGLPDADLPGYRRSFMNIMGFKPPEDEGGGRVSPVPSSLRAAITHLQTGFGMAMVEAEPDNGVMMHVHDTNETFMVLEGRWRMTWEGDQGNDSIEMGRYDVIAFPPHVQRQFHCIEAGHGRTKGLLLGVIGGDQPSAEYSPEAVQVMIAAGKLQPQ